MKEEVICELRHIGTQILIQALEYAQKASEENDEKKAAEYKHISDGLMMALGKLDERIQEIRREGL